MFTLDSNILIAYFNDDEKIIRQFSNWRKNNVCFFISVIAQIEVLSLPGLTFEDIYKIKRFLREFTIIPLDVQLGEMSADIRRQHRLKLGDSIIVATAQLTNSILITLDKEIIKKTKKIIKVKSV
ncbi:PIN domain-containing protein [Patescibacteria group bacterium]|nr:type II toxin-antitoxin system VapC family toxin [Candidatus Falkowbacteria bacterium]MBU3905879.1 PIN domain-containing protein [Patescibacteria group bacterium]MBU4015764.1 PIN domain-containing protein [Patescibacteria group bacterium]MBU4026993.1 PIN domain-containing protein [Patescibacteria group bacterium]MBU4072778.1 PIN domain-containing protein [Patescibacteria group bacterium]